MAQPTAYEQYILELINRARANPGAEAARLGIGLNDGLPAGTLSNTPEQPLAFNPDLIAAAQGHSVWMLTNNTFSHTGVNGSSPGDRMTTAGYHFVVPWGWGENVAIRYGGGVTQNLAMADALETQLFNSPNHRTNILDASFREAGVGIAAGSYQGQSAVDVTQDFAYVGSGNFLTGVAYNDLNGDKFYEPGEGLGQLTIVAKSSTGATYQTTTLDAGGYQMKLPSGTYQVTFSGGILPGPVIETATIGAQNTELDLLLGVTPTPVPTQDTLDIAVSEDAWLGDAQFMVSVDGKPVGGVQTAHTLHATRDDGHVLLTGSWGLSLHDVRIAFINDASNSNANDRNLYVDSIALNGTAYAGTSRTFALNEAHDFAVGGTTPKAALPPDKLVLHLSEDAFQGDAQFQVSVDGKTLNTPQAVTAIRAAGAIQDFTFTGNFGNGPHDVQVSFVNDAWGGTSATDRNLFVNSVSFDSHSYGGTKGLYFNSAVHFAIPS